MSSPSYSVLFLCTHNSARSVIAECIINSVGGRRFRGLSAGSQPSGRVNPHAQELLKSLNYDVSALRSKSWEEFSGPGAEPIDFIFTVCDDAANEVCPVWPGQPMTAHWGVPDPSRVEGTEAVKRQAFAETHRMLYQRITIFTALPFDELDRMTLKKRLEDIGKQQAQPA
jgi:arsenate reductase (thioredoxin)